MAPPMAPPIAPPIAPMPMAPPIAPPRYPPPDAAAGLGAPQLKQLVLDAKTLARHDGHVQSPCIVAPPPDPTNRSTESASVSSTARLAAMTTRREPLMSHFPLPFSTFIVAPD